MSGEVMSITMAEAGFVLDWLARFETAIGAGDREGLESLFLEDSHWRDMLAFTWTVAPHEGRASVVDGLLRHQKKVQARNFAVAQGRMPPRIARRLGIEVIEAIFSFETDAGRCHGVLRLPRDDATRAWVVSSALTEIK